MRIKYSLLTPHAKGLKTNKLQSVCIKWDSNSKHFYEHKYTIKFISFLY